MTIPSDLKPFIIGVMTTQFSEIYMQASSRAEAEILAKDYWRQHMMNRPGEPAHKIVSTEHFIGQVLH